MKNLKRILAAVILSATVLTTLMGCGAGEMKVDITDKYSFQASPKEHGIKVDTELKDYEAYNAGVQLYTKKDLAFNSTLSKDTIKDLIKSYQDIGIMSPQEAAEQLYAKDKEIVQKCIDEKCIFRVESLGTTDGHRIPTSTGGNSLVYIIVAYGKSGNTEYQLTWAVDSLSGNVYAIQGNQWITLYDVGEY